MSNITNGGLTRSDTRCFIAVPIWLTVGVKGLTRSCNQKKEGRFSREEASISRTDSHDTENVLVRVPSVHLLHEYRDALLSVQLTRKAWCTGLPSRRSSGYWVLGGHSLL